MKAAIVGVTGYTGIELVRLIQQHPLLDLGTLHSQQMHKDDISKLLPHFVSILHDPVEPFDAELIMQNNDLVFFATPSGISKDVVPAFVANDFPVIDLSGDLRLQKKGAYEQWYGQTAAETKVLEEAFYALPEFYEVAKGNLISNPGCYATATELTLAPLVQEKLIDINTIIVDGKSGLSGAGKKLADSSHYVNAHDNMTMYKLNQHQHIPEIIQQLQLWDEQITTIQFTTSLIPVTRGIFLSTYVKLKEQVSQKMIDDAFQACYAKKPFVRIQEQLPQLKQVIGTNFCDISYDINPENGILTIVTVIDNLMKGASGQAVQNFNKWAQIEETSGLLEMPLFP